MFRRMVVPILLLTLVLTATTVMAATGPGNASRQAATRAPATPVTSGDAVTLKVTTFNIWLGGDQVDFGRIADVVRASGADVVGVQEAEGNIPRLAAELGWQWFDQRQQVVSRFPLLDPPGADGAYLFVAPLPGQVFAISNIHLPSDPYGPEAARDGATVDEVVAIENETRLPPLRERLDRLAALTAAGMPVILTGDFNAPAATDWTPDAVATRGLAFPVEWPTSQAMVGAGFIDTYRTVHPDPVVAPGLTWTPGYPAPLVRPGETLDRIDFVWAAGPITPVSSEVIGEAGGASTDIAVTPYPSDHRAVVSTVTIALAVPPVMVTPLSRSVALGEPLTVAFHATGADGERVVLVPSGGSIASAVVSMTPRETYVDGTITFGTDPLGAGPWDAVLVGADGAELSRATVWLHEPGARPEIAIEAPVAVAESTVDVAFTNAPGARWDWVALYARGDHDLQNYLGYVYTDARIDGSVTLDLTGIAPGEYAVRLMLDDGYVDLAAASLTIELAPGATGTPVVTPAATPTA